MRQAEFIGYLDTRLVDELTDVHELLAPFGFYSAILETEILVPQGFRTDFASVPRLAGAYLMFGGKGKRAAVIHDAIYSGLIVGVGNHAGALSRDRCDGVFREALKVSGYSSFTIWCMYQGVRIGGASRFTAPNLPQPPHFDAVIEAP